MSNKRLKRVADAIAKEGETTEKRSIAGSHKKQTSILRALQYKNSNSTDFGPTPKQAHLEQKLDHLTTKLENAKKQKVREALKKRINDVSNEIERTSDDDAKHSTDNEDAEMQDPDNKSDVEEVGNSSSSDESSTAKKTATKKSAWHEWTSDSEFSGEDDDVESIETPIPIPTKPTLKGYVRPSRKGKNQSPITNSTSKQPKVWQGKRDWKDILQEPTTTEAKRSTNIRLRTSFDFKQRDNLPLSIAIENKRVLTQFNKVLQIADPGSRIITWEEGDTNVGLLNPEELNPYDSNPYLDAPNNYINNYGTQRRYRIGIRINTDLELDDFINKWSKHKKEHGWTHIAPAEMQTSSKPILLGMCQGSSPRKDCKLLNEELSKKYGTKVEASWQYINDPTLRGITNHLWEEAKTKAKQGSSKGDTSTFNRIKQRWSPSALCIYTEESPQTKNIQHELMKEYGQEVDGKWGEWGDGSRMRFTPSLFTDDPTIIKKIGRRIQWQVFCKATEVALDVPVTDIHDKKDYLGGKSLIEIIHGRCSKTNNNVSLFKNVIRKWTPTPGDVKYQVTVYSAFADEATQAILSLKSDLHDIYGNKVLQHFPNDCSQDSYTRGRKAVTRKDPELEKLFTEEKTEVQEGILQPDFISILEAQELCKEGAQKETEAHDGSTEAYSYVTDGDTQTTKDDDSSTSKRTTNTRASAISWDPTVPDMTKAPDDYTESSRIQKKLDIAGISSSEFEEWRKQNNEYVKLFTSISNTKYDIYNHLAKTMIYEKTTHNEERLEMRLSGLSMDNAQEDKQMAKRYVERLE